MTEARIFISYSSHNSFEASLLQYAIETMLEDEHVKAWTYQRDQERSEQEVARTIKRQIRDSTAMVLLLSPATVSSGATQWMELAYADAFDVRTFVLLHQLDFNELKAREKGVPPLLLASQCNPAIDWPSIVDDLRALLRNTRS